MSNEVEREAAEAAAEAFITDVAKGLEEQAHTVQRNEISGSITKIGEVWIEISARPERDNYYRLTGRLKVTVGSYPHVRTRSWVDLSVAEVVKRVMKLVDQVKVKRAAEDAGLTARQAAQESQYKADMALLVPFAAHDLAAEAERGVVSLKLTPEEAAAVADLLAKLRA